MKMKKILSGILSMTMLASILSVSVFADDSEVITYEDDFTVDYYFTQGNSNATKDAPMYFNPKAKRVLAVNSDRKWTTSSIWTGNNESTQQFQSGSYAYTPYSAKGAGVGLKCYGNDKAAALNLDLGSNRANKIYSVSARSQVGARAVRFMVSSDEHSFYELGFLPQDKTIFETVTKNATYIPSIQHPKSGKNMGRPYFRKVVNGYETALSMNNVSNIISTSTNEDITYTVTNTTGDATSNAVYWSNFYKNSTDNYSANNWLTMNADINYETNEITVEFVSQETGGVKFTYKDEGLNEMVNDTYYPAALCSAWGYSARFGDFKVKYDIKDTWDYYEDFSDTSSSVYEGTTLAKRDADTDDIITNPDKITVSTTQTQNTYPAKYITVADTSEGAEEGATVKKLVMAGSPFTSGTDTSILTNNGADYSYGGIHGINTKNSSGYIVSYAGMLEGSAVVINDRHWKGSTVNTDISENTNASKIADLSEVHVRKSASSWIGQGIKLLSDSTQKTFYIVGIMPNTYNSLTGKEVTAFTPFIAKKENGQFSVQQLADKAITANDWNTQGNILQAKFDINVKLGYQDITAEFAFERGQKISVTLNDESLTSMRKNAKYPVSLVSCGDGYTAYDKVAMNFRGYTPVAEEGYSFTDHFDSYANETNGVGSADNAVHSVPGTAQTVGKNNDFSWELSDIWYGYHTANAEYSKAYIDYSKERIGIADYYQKGTTVNLNLGEKDFAWISSVEFDSTKGDSRRGARALVNSYEDTFWEFVTARAFDSNITGNPYTGNQPYVRKVVKGMVVYEEIYSGEAVFNGTETWKISFADDGTVSWTITDQADSTKTWASSYSDDALDSMMNECKYPISLYALGDGYSYFDNVKLIYTENLPLFEIKDSDTLTVTVQPIVYRRFMQNKDYLTVIAAYYSAENELIKTIPVIITDLQNNSVYDIPSVESVSGAVSGKIFVWDSAVQNVSKLYSESL